MSKKVPVQLVLNGQECAAFVESGATLLEALRGKFDDMSPKAGCRQGTCGGCSVIVNGTLQLSCLVLAETCEGASIETAAGLANPEGIHPIQQAFLDGFAAQCGFCTPGMIMAAKALLDAEPDPTRQQVIEALSGNICRCTGYEPIIAAVLSVAKNNRSVTA